MERIWSEKLLNRFTKYAKVYTESKPGVDEIPSTPQQWDLAKMLKEELEEMGLENVSIDQHAYVMGYLPSNQDKELPTIGFISHFDTSPDFSGKDVQPQIWEDYNGEDVVLNSEENIVLEVKEFPELENFRGQTLITTNGKTLLGADDKAGLAEIVTAVEYLINHPEIPRPRIAVGFTPDEEVGKGAHLFDVEKFDADWAYTMDGSSVGELEYENFNAAGATIKIQGKVVHPGYAKGKMVNAIHLSRQFLNLLPENEVPEATEGREGFFHVTNIQGDVDHVEIEMIIRDHDEEKFEKRKNQLKDIADKLNQSLGRDRISVIIENQYFNMRKHLEDKMHIIDLAEEAMNNLDIKPLIKPIRGGTDGAQLSYKGLPCPNIFAGGQNFHSRYEYVTLEAMESATKVIIEIAKLAGSKF
ncbi:peptidase T [Candidatus Ornithobacterium hominis]|uniref:peptidase T n=1 Tax=Candidatus Ornithobacterium hominis TaxID=2497989 RepID=UPI0024BD3736|nr:peptidase T [Candidatus Ornithobacterium hominis]CAI9429560.1 peptidase T [Candidatus Ornithobacterium hominis]